MERNVVYGTHLNDVNKCWQFNSPECCQSLTFYFGCIKGFLLYLETLWERRVYLASGRNKNVSSYRSAKGILMDKSLYRKSLKENTASGSTATECGSYAKTEIETTIVCVLEQLALFRWTMFLLTKSARNLFRARCFNHPCLCPVVICHSFAEEARCCQ